MKPGSRERYARIETLARALARSGRYRGYLEIESILASRGLPEARKVFANRWSQAEVDRLCLVARSFPQSHDRAA